jgi:hypothetical protein
MKPSEINEIDKHDMYAAERLRGMFRPGIEHIKPETERKIKLKSRDVVVWRMAWNITEDFIKARSILGMTTPAAFHDVKYQRKYVMDIYPDHSVIDYIVEKDDI